MSTPNGVISRLHRPLAPVIGKCASGEHVGKAPRAWPTRPVRERRGVFPPEVRAQATAVACSLPQAQGVPLARWSRTELARWVAAASELPAVSASTIGRWLKAERIRPWRYHAWQRIQNLQTFLERAGPVLRVYERASALLREGTWLVCVDEKTSIQAREAEQGPRAALPGQGVQQSPRYHRRGMRHLMAGLSVADGFVAGRCSTRKRFVDFRAFLEEVIIAEALRRQVQQVILILDNGPTHAPKQLARWLEEQAIALKGKLTLEVLWLPVNASWLDQIEIWFSILQRKLLQPNHFLSTASLEQAISDFIAYYNQTAKPIKWSYTVEKLERKLGVNL
jgi:transposase